VASWAESPACTSFINALSLELSNRPHTSILAHVRKVTEKIFRKEGLYLGSGVLAAIDIKVGEAVISARPSWLTYCPDCSWITRYLSIEVATSIRVGRTAKSMRKQNPRKKRRVPPKTVLRLPDFEQAKSAVLNSLTSNDAQRGYLSLASSGCSRRLSCGMNRFTPDLDQLPNQPVVLSRCNLGFEHCSRTTGHPEISPNFPIDGSIGGR
jgi:hypothetical protein